MKFLSDILAKAGLTVDGVVTLNNTATGQTPAANDNSTKLATTAWVRGFVTPYSLPIASGLTLGGIKIGSGLAIDGTGIVSVAATGVGAIRALQQFTATAGQTVFTVSGGYTPGLIDVFLNGVLLTPTSITASNGTIFTLSDAALVNDVLDVFVYNPIYGGFISSTDQVPEGATNLYYTNARARAAVSLTTTGVSGAATYNSSTGVFNIPNYQGLVPSGGTAGQILTKNSSTDYDSAWIENYADWTAVLKHRVKASEAITKGQAVYVSSADGTNMIVSKASNATEGTSSKTMGLLESTVSTNGIANVITEGLLTGLNTATATAGDPVWLGTGGNLIYGLLNKPVAPAHLVFIGIVTRVNANNGEIFVKIQNGFELDELHDLSVKNASDGDMIKYVASTGLWTKIAATTTNITEGTNLYYTDARSRAAISVTGSGSYNSTTGVITVTGGVTSVNTLTDAVTLTTTNIAEGTNLYYTDARVGTYLTTNSYATQTYVGTQIANLVASAPATLDTLNELAAALGNDPSFATTVATSIGTKVPQTRTITINGTGYDLSADRSWTIASGVTSFNTRTGAITSANGDYTTAQVTESGNLYYTDTRVRAAISLTTTGTSGAATYDSATGIFNIPQYQGGVTSFNTRTGAISLTSSDVTTALTYTPVTNARTLTINGTAYDLTADRTWTVGVSPSARTIQTYTATASQTTFTVTGGYVVGLVDVFINGVRLTSVDYTATNGTTIVLSTGTGVGNIVDIVKYTSAFIVNNALRQTTYFTATAGQTTFTIGYTPGLVDVFYNGSKLASTEYTALNGTSIVLSTAASLNDVIEVTAYTYSVGAYSGQAQLNGTGLVRMSGTTVSYDNNTYLTTSSASTTYLPLVGGTITGVLNLNNSTSNRINFGTNGVASPTFTTYSDGVKIILYDTLGSTALGYTIGIDAGTLFNTIPAADAGQFFKWYGGTTLLASLGGTGIFTVNSLVKSGGTSSQFLKADGSVDSNTYLTTGTATSTYLPLSGGTLTGSLNGTTATFSGPTVTIGSAVAATNVKLLLNGVASKAAGIEFQQGGTAQWYLGNGIASEDNNFELYNSNGTMAMKIIKSTNAINFIGNITGTGSVTVVNGIYTLPALTPSYFGYSGYGVLIVGNSNSAQTRSIAFNVDVSGNPSGAFNGYGSEYIWRNAGSFITPNSVNNGYNTLLSWNSAGLVTFNQETIFNSTTTVAGNGVYGNGRTGNSAGTTVLNIMGSSSSSTSAQLNLTQVWNGVQYPIVLKNIYNSVGGAASSVFTLSTTQWNGSAAITTERFRVDGNDGIITIGDTLGYTTAQKGQFFSKGGGSMFTANLLSGGFGRHFTMQRNDSTKWHIGVDGSDNFGIMDSADSFIMTLTGGGVMTANTFKSNVTPGSPTLDSAGSFVTLANGGFVDFPAMSGMIIVNNTGTGAVQVFICGGGNTASLGAVVNVTGTMTHSPGVGGYRFTNNTGSSWAFAFQVFKTRGTA